ncbi:hypothetical protein CB1_002523019 [Camelus ferus]|nr:hypothetical protein CB1_002523019 [Camelus ferus]
MARHFSGLQCWRRSAISASLCMRLSTPELPGRHLDSNLLAHISDFQKRGADWLSGNRKKKHRLPTGFQKVLFHNVQGLQALLMCNSSYFSEMARNSSKIGKAILERAAQLAVRVTDPNARLPREESG